MANPCNIYANWDSIDQVDELGDLINQALEEWGYDQVEIVEGEGPGGGAPGEYDDGTIYLDSENEDFDNPQDGISIAYHEAMHAMLDQEGLSTFDIPEEFEAAWLGARAADQALQGCTSDEPVSDSFGDDSYAPPHPWVSDPDTGY